RIIRSQSSSPISSRGLPWMMPALLNRTSRRPQRSYAVSSIRSMSARRVTSACTARPPSLAASRPAAAPSRSARSTRPPSAARRSAQAAPMPLAPPVIRIVRPASRPSTVITNLLSALSGPSGDEVDLDAGAERQRGDPDAGPGGQAAGGEIALVDPVHPLVVLLEVREEDAAGDDARQRQAEPVQYPDQVVERPAGLGLDPAGQW